MKKLNIKFDSATVTLDSNKQTDKIVLHVVSEHKEVPVTVINIDNTKTPITGDFNPVTGVVTMPAGSAISTFNIDQTGNHATTPNGYVELTHSLTSNNGELSGELVFAKTAVYNTHVEFAQSGENGSAGQTFTKSGTDVSYSVYRGVDGQFNLLTGTDTSQPTLEQIATAMSTNVNNLHLLDKVNTAEGENYVASTATNGIALTAHFDSANGGITYTTGTSETIANHFAAGNVHASELNTGTSSVLKISENEHHGFHISLPTTGSRTFTDVVATDGSGYAVDTTTGGSHVLTSVGANGEAISGSVTGSNGNIFTSSSVYTSSNPQVQSFLSSVTQTVDSSTGAVTFTSNAPTSGIAFLGADGNPSTSLTVANGGTGYNISLTTTDVASFHVPVAIAVTNGGDKPFNLGELTFDQMANSWSVTNPQEIPNHPGSLTYVESNGHHVLSLTTDGTFTPTSNTDITWTQTPGTNTWTGEFTNTALTTNVNPGATTPTVSLTGQAVTQDLGFDITVLKNSESGIPEQTIHTTVTHNEFTGENTPLTFTDLGTITDMSGNPIVTGTTSLLSTTTGMIPGVNRGVAGETGFKVTSIPGFEIKYEGSGNNYSATLTSAFTPTTDQTTLPVTHPVVEIQDENGKVLSLGQITQNPITGEYALVDETGKTLSLDGQEIHTVVTDKSVDGQHSSFAVSLAPSSAHFYNFKGVDTTSTDYKTKGVSTTTDKTATGDALSINF